MGDFRWQLGTVGEWASGIGALAVIVVTWRLWLQERRDRFARDARKIAVRAHLYRDNGFAMDYDFEVENRSDEPIYYVRVWAMLPWGDRCEPIVPLPATIGADRSEGFTIQIPKDETFGHNPPQMCAGFISFNDHGGTRWINSSHDRPQRQRKSLWSS